MQNKKRFVCIGRWRGLRAAEVWVDTQTGVNYIYMRAGFSGGLAPLLDANGKPIVSEEYIRKD